MHRAAEKEINIFTNVTARGSYHANGSRGRVSSSCLPTIGTGYLILDPTRSLTTGCTVWPAVALCISTMQG